MHIKMLETRRVAGAGTRLTIEYVQGELYDVADNIARGLISRGWARPPTREEIEAIFGVMTRQATEQAVYAAKMALQPISADDPPAPVIALPTAEPKVVQPEPPAPPPETPRPITVAQQEAVGVKPADPAKPVSPKRGRKFAAAKTA